MLKEIGLVGYEGDEDGDESFNLSLNWLFGNFIILIIGLVFIEYNELVGIILIMIPLISLVYEVSKVIIDFYKIYKKEPKKKVKRRKTTSRTIRRKK